MENIKQLLRGNDGEYVAYYDEKTNEVSLSPIRFWAIVKNIEKDYECDIILPITADSESLIKNTSSTDLDNGLLASNCLGIIWGNPQLDLKITNPENWQHEIEMMKRRRRIENGTWNQS